MKLKILLFLSLFTSTTLLAQRNDTWTSFWNKDTTLLGFKDKNGNVKIEPKFSGLTAAGQFENIIAVTEERNEQWFSYYLTKSGKIVGRDSLYTFDMAADCENEGFIRFHDRKTDKQGMFNKYGEIAIPAAYSDLTLARNGMVVALSGATKKQDGEHYYWEGGRFMLIDTNNNVLIDSFVTDYNNINFYSLQIADQPAKDSIRNNYKGINGQFYSFIDYEKEFRSWLKTALLDHFTKTALLNSSFDKITSWKKQEGWISESKTSFVNRNYEKIKTRLLALLSNKYDYSIFHEGLNHFIFESPEYRHYYNNCGESKDWIYPVKNVVISHHNKKEMKQDHFEFLRTERGYKLISVSLAAGDNH